LQETYGQSVDSRNLTPLDGHILAFDLGDDAGVRAGEIDGTTNE
jgi:hypothetical protein